MVGRCGAGWRVWRYGGSGQNGTGAEALDHPADHGSNPAPTMKETVVALPMVRADQPCVRCSAARYTGCP